MQSRYPLVFTALWLVWCALWAARSLVVRRGRAYAKGREVQDQNKRYRYTSYMVYLSQIVIGVWSFWSTSPLLFQFPINDGLRAAGIAICYLGLALSLLQLHYLGANYSPCFDSHLPKEIIRSGPYRFVRHPGWSAKILTAAGSILATGSLWFLPMVVWFVIELRRTIRVEENYLVKAFPEYRAYQQATKRLVPFIY